MANESLIEQRLLTVEDAVAELRRRLDGIPSLSDWLDRVTGSISDEAAFLEVLEFGRAIRSADRPSDRTEDVS